ncbi:(d)CMP kinase [candidate division KSB1 bacterium]|nr:(d)CMP kinase [candidate division KSB1 bacterium]
MGAGKSSVGKILAEKLNRNFHDTDRIIEASTKKSISEIFESKGEDYFRDREEEIVKKITNTKIIYLSTVKMSDIEKEEMTKQPNIVDFIQKPFDINDLLARVKKALGK